MVTKIDPVRRAKAIAESNARIAKEQAQRAADAALAPQREAKRNAARKAGADAARAQMQAAQDRAIAAGAKKEVINPIQGNKYALVSPNLRSQIDAASASNISPWNTVKKTNYLQPSSAMPESMKDKQALADIARQKSQGTYKPPTPLPFLPFAGEDAYNSSDSFDFDIPSYGMKKGGAVKAKSKMKSGVSKSSSASKRGDGIAQRGKTKGRMV